MTRDPLQELLALQNKMNRLFEESMRSRSAEESSTGAWIPPIDIYETAGSLIVKVDLPEVNREDIEIRLENGVLTLRGERKLREDVKNHDCLRLESHYGAFSRSLTLPRTVNAERIQAQYKDGVLFLEIPKEEAPGPRQIEIT